MRWNMNEQTKGYLEFLDGIFKECCYMFPAWKFHTEIDIMEMGTVYVLVNKDANLILEYVYKDKGDDNGRYCIKFHKLYTGDKTNGYHIPMKITGYDPTIRADCDRVGFWIDIVRGSVKKTLKALDGKNHSDIINEKEDIIHIEL
jgi:hypothetical protein